MWLVECGNKQELEQLVNSTENRGLGIYLKNLKEKYQHPFSFFIIHNKKNL